MAVFILSLIAMYGLLGGVGYWAVKKQRMVRAGELATEHNDRGGRHG